jgi:hypothetical protein
MLMGMAFELVSNGLLLDPEEKAPKNALLWAVVMGNAHGLARYGRMLAVLEARVLNQPWADRASLAPVWENMKALSTSLYKANENYAKGKTEQMKKNLVAAGKYISQLAGVQAKQAFDIYDDVESVVTGESDRPVRQLMGIYDPDYSAGLELKETFDSDAWEEARQEKAALEQGRRQGVPGREVRKALEDR